MAWLNLTMPNQTVKNGLKPKKIKLPQMNFFIKKKLIKFSCTYQPFSFCKILKKFLELIQSYDDVPFSGPEWPICPEQIFFKYKPLLLLSFTYWPFSLCKILPVDPELCGCAIFGPKMAHMRIFSENLLMSLVSFIHAICMPKIKGRY